MELTNLKIYREMSEMKRQEENTIKMKMNREYREDR